MKYTYVYLHIFPTYDLCQTQLPFRQLKINKLFLFKKICSAPLIEQEQWKEQWPNRGFDLIDPKYSFSNGTSTVGVPSYFVPDDFYHQKNAKLGCSFECLIRR